MYMLFRGIPGTGFLTPINKKATPSAFGWSIRPFSHTTTPKVKHPASPRITLFKFNNVVYYSITMRLVNKITFISGKG
jgi:hypothetical protein